MDVLSAGAPRILLFPQTSGSWWPLGWARFQDCAESPVRGRHHVRAHLPLVMSRVPSSPSGRVFPGVPLLLNWQFGVPGWSLPALGGDLSCVGSSCPVPTLEPGKGSDVTEENRNEPRSCSPRITQFTLLRKLMGTRFVPLET